MCRNVGKFIAYCILILLFMWELLFPYVSYVYFGCDRGLDTSWSSFTVVYIYFIIANFSHSKGEIFFGYIQYQKGFFYLTLSLLRYSRLDFDTFIDSGTQRTCRQKSGKEWPWPRIGNIRSHNMVIRTWKEEENRYKIDREKRKF